jgi:hypothetical protein
MSGKKICKAAEFLIEHLLKKEEATAEIYRIGERKGIAVGTLKRAKKLVGVSSRKIGREWYMTISGEEAMEKVKKQKEQGKKRQISKYERQYEVSTDWVRVTNGESEATEDSVQKDAGVRIKVGGYEIEAGSEFPVEKLAEILRGIGGERRC